MDGWIPGNREVASSSGWWGRVFGNGAARRANRARRAIGAWREKGACEALETRTLLTREPRTPHLASEASPFRR